MWEDKSKVSCGWKRARVGQNCTAGRQSAVRSLAVSYVLVLKQSEQYLTESIELRPPKSGQTIKSHPTPLDPELFVPTSLIIPLKGPFAMVQLLNPIDMATEY